MTQQASQQTAAARHESDLAAIREAAMDYAQGWYEGDVERMRRCLHPDLAKRRIMRDPESGEERLRQVNQELLVDLTRQGGGSEIPADKRYYDVSMLEVAGDIASLRVNSYQYVDYLHLARSEGRWLIVNVLYQVIRLE